MSIPGVSVANFLRTAINAKREEPIKVKEFGQLLKKTWRSCVIEREFTSRYLNDGFSGGEKKRAEILQMAMLEPAYAVLDETDSGLDIDALRIVSDGVNALRGPDLGALIITHYTRILGYVRPDFVHIMLNGRIVQEGGPELADHARGEGLRLGPRGGGCRRCRLSSSKTAARRRSRSTSASRCRPGAARASGPRRCDTCASTSSSRATTTPSSERPEIVANEELAALIVQRGASTVYSRGRTTTASRSPRSRRPPSRTPSWSRSTGRRA